MEGIRLVSAPVYGGSDRAESKAMVNADRNRALLWKATGIICYPHDVLARKEGIRDLDDQ